MNKDEKVDVNSLHRNPGRMDIPLPVSCRALKKKHGEETGNGT